MKEYIKRLRKNFFLWQTRLFGSLISFFFFSFFFLTQEFQTTLGYSENIFVFHVPLAWLSLLLYAFLLNYYCIFKKKLISLLLVNLYLNMVTILSGVCWGKLSFGFFLFYDSKILAYLFLFVFLVGLYLTSPKPSVLFWLTGFLLLLQERSSTYFLNSMHQAFIVEVFSDSEFLAKTISFRKNLIVIFTLLMFCLKI